MKKTIAILLMICTLTLCLVSCGHEHEWSNATYENPKMCQKCGETDGMSIKEMLLGEWKEEGASSNSYVGICFTNDGFTSDVVLNGEASGIFPDEGTVTVSDDTIQLINDDGSGYTYFTYIIDENGISLTGKDGEKWTKSSN